MIVATCPKCMNRYAAIWRGQFSCRVCGHKEMINEHGTESGCRTFGREGCPPDMPRRAMLTGHLSNGEPK